MAYPAQNNGSVQDLYEIFFSDTESEYSDSDVYDFTLQNPLRSNAGMPIVNIEQEQLAQAEQPVQVEPEQQRFEPLSLQNTAFQNEIIYLLALNRDLQNNLNFVHANIMPPKLTHGSSCMVSEPKLCATVSTQTMSQPTTSCSTRPFPSTNPPCPSNTCFSQTLSATSPLCEKYEGVMPPGNINPGATPPAPLPPTFTSLLQHLHQLLLHSLDLME